MKFLSEQKHLFTQLQPNTSLDGVSSYNKTSILLRYSSGTKCRPGISNKRCLSSCSRKPGNQRDFKRTSRNQKSSQTEILIKPVIMKQRYKGLGKIVKEIQRVSITVSQISGFSNRRHRINGTTLWRGTSGKNGVYIQFPYGKVPIHLITSTGNIRGTINVDELCSGKTGHVHAELNT